MSKSIPIPTAEAMRKRYGKTSTKMRDKRTRRSKDARKSWRADHEEKPG